MPQEQNQRVKLPFAPGWLLRSGFGGLAIGAIACILDGLSVAPLLRLPHGTVMHALPPAGYVVPVALIAFFLGLPLCIHDIIMARRRRDMSHTSRFARTLLFLLGVALNLGVLPLTGELFGAAADWRGWVISE